MTLDGPNMLRVRQALEHSWSADTAYEQAFHPGVPALGQCYPTARVLQLLYPALEIVEGTVLTGATTHQHFWNLLVVDDTDYHLDLTWQQFPPGAEVGEWRIRDRDGLGDGPTTVERVELLLGRVRTYLATQD